MPRAACRAAATYEELVALHLADQQRLHEHFKEQGQVVLALDGLQPDIGHEVLWVLRRRFRLHPFSGAELCPADLTRWRALRNELDHRHEARRMQHRFRKSPESYLAVLEEKLIKESLPT